MSNEIQQLFQALQKVEEPQPPKKHRKPVPIPRKIEPDAVSLELHTDSVSAPKDGELEWLHSSYKRLAFVVFVQGLNHAVEFLYNWKDHNWIVREHPKLKAGTRTFRDISNDYNLSIYEARELYYKYDTDVNKDPIEWFLSARATPFLEILDIEPEAAIDLAHQIVSDERQIGIAEPDIELLVLPQYDDTVRKRQAMGRFLQTSFAAVTKIHADTR